MRFSRIAAALLTLSVVAPAVRALPKVIIISLDGRRPASGEAYLADGTLNANEGFGLLKSKGNLCRT